MSPRVAAAAVIAALSCLVAWHSRGEGELADMCRAALATLAIVTSALALAWAVMALCTGQWWPK